MDKLLNSKKGVYRTIVGIDKSAPLKIKRRILELGFTPNQRVRIERKSLLGKAFLVELRGYILTIRKDIAGMIIVE